MYSKKFLVLISIFIICFSLFVHASETTQKTSEHPAQQEKQIKICLNMIVKNEGQIILRCLNSVKGIVDCISICDTGSTDDTVAIIEQFLKDNKIPGEVHHHSWKDFGHNRTLSAQAAKETLKKLDFPLKHTYLLLLDADMVLNQKADFNVNELEADSYLVVQKSNELAYHNTRLIRASLPWLCLGVTHEYWMSPFKSKKSDNLSKKLDTLLIDDINDGGCKSDKFERDLRLLEQGLKESPNNTRYHFYYAQTFFCLKRFEEAIEWYKKRIEKGGWKEEVWYSKYMIGQSYDNLKDWDHALKWYLDAYRYDPSRAEPLYNIATYYRNNKQYDLAYAFAKEGKKIKYPENAVLFVSHPVYDYLFDEEISIAAYYTSNKEEGFKAANRLVLKKNIPEKVKELAEENILYYVSNLKDATFIPIKIDLPKINDILSYNPCNPSIQKDADGYTVICRTVNYSHTGGVDYKSMDPKSPIIRTKNFLLKCDDDLNILSQKEITHHQNELFRNSLVNGIEDCRLFKWNDKDWFVCTINNTSKGKVEQYLGETETGPNIHVDLTALKIENQHRCEKNWLPFIKDNQVHFIYQCEPLTVYRVNSDTSACEITYQNEHASDYSSFRNSAGPIEFDDGYLMLIHEVIKKETRKYTHRFVFLDKNFHITKVSKPFTFQHLGIEYCCGMTIDHSGKQCILPIGIEDKEAYLCIVPLDTIRSLLE